MGNWISIFQKKESPLEIRKRDSKPSFDSEGYFRYLRLGRSLLYMKEALHEPVRFELKKLHKEILEYKKEKENLFKNKDDETVKKILCNYVQNKYCCLQNVDICKSNLNMQNMASMEWEIAKLFMQPGQREENTGPEKTDVMGILRLISGCNVFKDWLQEEIGGTNGYSRIGEVLQLRHELAHSFNLCCSEEQMEQGIGDIRNLLKHIQKNFKRFVADGRIADQEGKRIFHIAEEEINEAFIKIVKVKTDTDFVKMRELVAKDVCSTWACESSIEAPDTVNDILILHCEGDTSNAVNFRKDYLETLSDIQPPVKTIIYDDYLVGGTSYLEPLERMLEECRLVFILYTDLFKQDNLALFQADVVKYTCLQRKESERVVPVYLNDQDKRNAPIWIQAVASIDIWNISCKNRLQNTIKQGRKKFLK